MKLETGLSRLKESHLFAHLTYCILSVTCLFEWFNNIQTYSSYEKSMLLWFFCILVLLALIPAQHKIVTKNFYRDTQHLRLYKIFYTTIICIIYVPITTGIIFNTNLAILTIVPVILNSIICGTAYGIVTSFVISLSALLTQIYKFNYNADILTGQILSLTLMVTTAWFIGQSFTYIMNLFYQLRESEKQHKDILDNLGTATLHIDRDGQVIYSNKYLKELFGKSITENTSFSDIINRHMPFLKDFHEELINTTATRDPVFGQAINSQGYSVPVQCIIYPASSGLDENNGVIIILNDLSLSEKLEAERIHKNYFIDFIDAGIVITDGAGEIIEMNNQAEVFLNISKQDMATFTLQDLFNKKLKQEANLSTNNCNNQEIELGEKTFLINSVELRGKESKTIGNVCIITDITDKKNMERKLQRSATLSAIGELAAGTAHEVRNPLTSIKGFLQLMREKKDTRIGDHGSYFDIILDEVDRINMIVSEFLKLAQSDKVTLYPVNLNKIIASIWELLKSEALLQEKYLLNQLDSSILPIMGNTDLLKQVIINLVSNALQATVEGGTVKVTTSRLDNDVQLTIEDNGIGIDPALVSRIFDPFFTTKDEGTGLGLAITSKIINDHNAVIKVSSEPSKGTSFYINFPAVKHQRGQATF